MSVYEGLMEGLQSQDDSSQYMLDGMLIHLLKFNFSQGFPL